LHFTPHSRFLKKLSGALQSIIDFQILKLNMETLQAGFFRKRGRRWTLVGRGKNIRKRSIWGKLEYKQKILLYILYSKVNYIVKSHNDICFSLNTLSLAKYYNLQYNILICMVVNDFYTSLFV
jgi:CRISPR/Cas system CMR-associated protein Cmr3 (group 5 of RAMP superfamily)